MSSTMFGEFSQSLEEKNTVVFFAVLQDKFVKGIQAFYIPMLKNWNIKGSPV